MEGGFCIIMYLSSSLKAICPFCGIEMQDVNNNGDVYEYKCDRNILGDNSELPMFFTENFISNHLKKHNIQYLSFAEKCMMLYFILKYKRKVIFSESPHEQKTLWGEIYTFVELSTLKKRYPDSVSKKIDMIAENLISLYPLPETPICFKEDKDFFSQKGKKFLFFSENENNIPASRKAFERLLDTGLIALSEKERSSDRLYYYLTSKAWERVYHNHENLDSIPSSGR